MFLSDNAIYDFSKKAVENGLDIFRVFDSLNYFGKFIIAIVCVHPLMPLIFRNRKCEQSIFIEKVRF